MGCILPHGDKIIVLAVEQRRNIRCGGSQRVIAGYCQHHRAFHPQLRFCRQRYRRITQPMCQPCQRGAGTWGDNQHIQHLLRPDGFYLLQGVQWLPPADMRNMVQRILCLAKPCILCENRFGYNGHQRPAILRHAFHDSQYPFNRTK